MTKRFSFALVAVVGSALCIPAMASELDLSKDGAAAGSVRPANSVRPVMPMSEQIKPCLTEHTDKAYVKVNINGLESDDGNVRVQVYGSNPDDFLSKGKKLKRVDVALGGENAMVCVDLPQPGTYAFVVMHDKDANGRANFLTEGFGFSNNPRLFLAPPDHEDVVVEVALGVAEMDIEMNYVSPSNKKDRNRRRRR